MTSVTQTTIPGGWTERDVVVGPHTFRLHLPADPDAFLSHLLAGDAPSADQPHLVDPYWAKLWPAALHLAGLIAGGPLLPAARALELGCGSGLVGLAALARGCEVTFSDYVPFTVELALENAARNGLAGARGLVLDWRSPRDEQFPLILAADVTYERTNIEPLLGVIEHMLAPGGEAWLADAGRGPVAEFLRSAAQRGWRVALFDEHEKPTAEPVLGHCQRIALRRS
jgi:predicted nicotinamide N-methyase